MALNLFAACRDQNAVLVAKRVPITHAVQNSLQEIFTEEENEFFAGVDEEVEFDGGWTPDDNELLTIDLPEEASALVDAITANLVATTAINSAAFEDEHIVALFAKSQHPHHNRILIQNFASHQILTRKGTLVLHENTFKTLTDPVFSIGQKLVAAIEGPKLKFKSYSNLRRVFDIVALFKEATDDDIDAFSAHTSVHLPDIDAFKSACDQTARRLVYAVFKRGVLDEHTPQEIVARAATVGVGIGLAHGRIEIPLSRLEIKNVLRFLDDGLYRAPLSGDGYIANSKRPVVL